MSKIIVDQIENLSGQNFVMPTSDGSSGQVVTTDGAGNLSFQSPPESTPTLLGNNILGIQLPEKQSMLNNETGSIIVETNAAHCLQAGASCVWTVPAGVSEAQFQIWGAGGTGTGCSGSCCSFGLPGGSGEYTYVRMAVSPGEIYTLCAGGAYEQGSCYSSTCFDGCNSFVCGSNSTCIMSCGGSFGYAKMCGSTARSFYPELATPYSSANSGNLHQTNGDQCRGAHFGKPGFRCSGHAMGQITSANTIKMSAKVPSIVGGTKSCGNSICYMCQYSHSVTPDHTICNYGTGWTGNAGGCCMDTVAAWNQPGIGGAGEIQACNINAVYGGRGRSGSVIVKYK